MHPQRFQLDSDFPNATVFTNKTAKVQQWEIWSHGLMSWLREHRGLPAILHRRILVDEKSRHHRGDIGKENLPEKPVCFYIREGSSFSARTDSAAVGQRGDDSGRRSCSVALERRPRSRKKGRLIHLRVGADASNAEAVWSGTRAHLLIFLL
ncbi:hypothetical protein AAFF_G00106720 [Aldrovandia affinis]|uniref:Uncharacterized protein n=1 Tax=Aldrovandia affinis TaxID=143900 RepID=A0AAD7T2B5_9TELE|nr:hypothetical protein AAFF_G00106720 [Aldrovandia affinis]